MLSNIIYTDNISHIINNIIFNNEKNALCDLSEYVNGIYSDKNPVNEYLIESYYN